MSKWGEKPLIFIKIISCFFWNWTFMLKYPSQEWELDCPLWDIGTLSTNSGKCSSGSTTPSEVSFRATLSKIFSRRHASDSLLEHLQEGCHNYRQRDNLNVRNVKNFENEFTPLRSKWRLKIVLEASLPVNTYSSISQLSLLNPMIQSLQGRGNLDRNNCCHLFRIFFYPTRVNQC